MSWGAGAPSPTTPTTAPIIFSAPISVSGPLSVHRNSDYRRPGPGKRIRGHSRWVAAFLQKITQSCDMCDATAGAIWEFPPYKIEPMEKAMRWALDSLSVFARLSAHQNETGVYLRRSHYMYDAEAAPSMPPDLRGHSGAVWDFRIHEGGTLPPETGPDFVRGFSYLTPVVVMPTYLLWLERLVAAAGAQFLWQGVASFAAASAAAVAAAGRQPDVVLNCSALGARLLCGDEGVRPVRGTLVLVRCPGVVGVYSDESVSRFSTADAVADKSRRDLTYIVPKGGDLVACAGCANSGDWSTTVTAQEADDVMERCARLVPMLRGAPLVASWAGLRPVRDLGVRLELSQDDACGVPIIHNYGHGGSGVICAWGCANDVARLAHDVAAARNLALDFTALPPLLAAGLPPLRAGGGRAAVVINTLAARL